jgi:hypothetical protein
VITYAIFIERADGGGFGAWCPGLSGCVGLGDAKPDTIAEMGEANRAAPCRQAGRRHRDPTLREGRGHHGHDQGSLSSGRASAIVQSNY